MESEADPDWYVVVIPHATRFELAMDMVPIGMSFRQTASAMQLVRECTKQALFSGVNDLLVSQYDRVLVGGNLQDISDLMEQQSVRAMSLAFNSSTHFEQSYLDLRVRLCVEGFLCILHVFCLPRYERHTSGNLFNVVCSLTLSTQTGVQSYSTCPPTGRTR